MTIRKSVIGRHPALAMCAGGALALAAFVGAFLGLPNTPRRNSAELVRALAEPRIEWSSADHSGIYRVVLANGIALVPERDEIVAGYVVRLHTRLFVFNIEAQPL